MAIVTRVPSEIPSIFPRKGTAADPVEPTPHPHDAEAPDRGITGEAPEARNAEAPDAGEGRANFIEHEFTHGRSQS